MRLLEPRVRIKDYLYLASAAVVGLFGLTMVLGAALQWSEGERSVYTWTLGLGLGVLPLASAVWLVRAVRVGSNRRRREQLERQVLQLAAAAAGRLTPAQVAQSTRLTLEESKAFLDRLGVEGHCRMELDDGGSVSYRFNA